mmetsp:Transcript_58111/g.147406  ORF Transcript_58111/g.147406 Transcript_58111/m.147406 type:complete len:224 (-) Transcript_58111:248-919(-)
MYNMVRAICETPECHTVALLVLDQQPVSARAMHDHQVATPQGRREVGIVGVHLAAIGMLRGGRQAYASTALRIQVWRPLQALGPGGPDELMRERVRVGRQLLDGVRTILPIVRLGESRLGTLQPLCAVEVRAQLLPGPSLTPRVQHLWVVAEIQRQGHQGAASQHPRRAGACQRRGEVRHGHVARLVNPRAETIVCRDVLVDDELVGEHDRARVSLWRGVGHV